MTKHPFRVVEISWIDSAASDTAWLDKRKLPLPVIIVTHGFLVAESNEHVCIASSYYDDTEGNMTIGEAIAIPKVAVLSPKKYKRK